MNLSTATATASLLTSPSLELISLRGKRCSLLTCCLGPRGCRCRLVLRSLLLLLLLGT